MSIYANIVKKIHLSLTTEEQAALKDSEIFESMVNGDSEKSKNCSMLLMTVVKAKMDLIETEQMHPEDIERQDFFRQVIGHGNGLYEESQCGCTINIGEEDEPLNQILDILELTKEDYDELKELF